MKENITFTDYIDDLYKSSEKSTSFSKLADFDKHFSKWNFFDFESELTKMEGEIISLKSPGQIFLYEKFETIGDKCKVSYPKVGVFLNYLPCDQTVDVEWFDIRRTWEYNRKFEYNSHEYTLSGAQSSIRSMPQWLDYLMIYGVWDKLPKWKELKRYYENTWWFHRTTEEKRDIKIDIIING